MYACVAVNVDPADILICYHPKQDVYNDADSCNKLFAVSSPTILDSKHHLASLILSSPVPLILFIHLFIHTRDYTSALNDGKTPSFIKLRAVSNLLSASQDKC